MTKMDDSVLPYIDGSKFSNNLSVKIASTQDLVDRIQFLCTYSKGKKIIHIGCVDHQAIIQKKIEDNTYLFQRIEEVALRQFGIDINTDGINFMKDTLGYFNVAAEDIMTDRINEEIKNDSWDGMILGEILEHVDNPVEFLSKIREKYSPYVKEIVITVPNALSIVNVVNAYLNRRKLIQIIGIGLALIRLQKYCSGQVSNHCTTNLLPIIRSKMVATK